MDAVRVRRLTAPAPAEIERLAAVFDSYREHYGQTAGASQTAAWLEHNVGGGRLAAFVAESDGAYVGFAVALAVPASLRLGVFWQVRDLFVLPRHRRRGVARQLLDAVRAAAIGDGALRLAVHTETGNGPALRLYAEYGFTPLTGHRWLTLPVG
jgi:GNAT superfamily N-acetyltransferase